MDGSLISCLWPSAHKWHKLVNGTPADADAAVFSDLLTLLPDFDVEFSLSFLCKRPFLACVSQPAIDAEKKMRKGPLRCPRDMRYSEAAGRQWMMGGYAQNVKIARIIARNLNRGRVNKRSIHPHVYSILEDVK
jgi:hypothetical protein